MEAFGRDRVEGEPGFAVQDREFYFRPWGNPDTYSRIWSAETDSETLTAIDAFVRPLLLSDAARQSWDEVRMGTDHHPPLWFDELFAIVRHIAAVTAGRPTMPSNGSSTTQQPTGTDSTGSSSFEVAAA